MHAHARLHACMHARARALHTRSHYPHSPPSTCSTAGCASASHSATLSTPTQTSIDLFNYLLRQRIIFLAGYVNDKVGLCTGLRPATAACTASPHQGALGKLVMLSLITNPFPHIYPLTHTQMATQIVGSLLALEAIDEEEDIRIYINSPGDGVEGAP